MLRFILAAGVLAAGQGAQLPPRPVTQIDPGAAAATLDSPRRLTLGFLEPRPIEEVLHLVFEGTPFSLAIDPDVSGKFRGAITNLTLREALTTLLAPLGLDFSVDGSVIRITRHRVETRQFDLNVLDVQRSLQRTTGSAPAAALTSTVVPEDAFASIEEGVKALLSETGRAHIDRRAGLATVTDFPERLERVALYLETLQVRSSREVRLQAEAFEITLKDRPSIDWNAVRDRLGVPPNAPLAGLAADPGALRAALSGQGEVRPLWTPEITTINNEPALVRIDTPGEASLTLTVVPQIAGDGIIQLAVSHTWQLHAGDQKQGFTKTAPVTRVSEGDTVSRIASGSAVLISGLAHSVQIPKQGTGAAALFGTQPKQSASAELVVLLRPTIVTTGTRD